MGDMDMTIQEQNDRERDAVSAAAQHIKDLTGAVVEQRGRIALLEAENATLRGQRDEAVKIERQRCLAILRSVNNHDNPMTAADCADLIEKGEACP